MASERARANTNLGTRIANIETDIAKAEAAARGNSTASMESRIETLEGAVSNLSSANYRLDAEYPSMDERYIEPTYTTDWNTAVVPGAYWATASAANTPIDNLTVGEVLTYGSGSSFRAQQTVWIPSLTEPTRSAVYTRVLVSGTWTDWTRETTEWGELRGVPSTFPTTVAQITNLSAGLASTGASVGVSDINTAVQTGFYIASGSTANTPDSSLWWNVTVENGGGRATQYARNIDRTGPVYKRWNTTTAVPATWSPWTLVYDERGDTVYSGTTAVRNAIFGSGDVALANRRVSWYNTDLGWHESYYMPTGTSGLTARGLATGTAAGWYPITTGPRLYVMASAAQSFSAAGNFSSWTGSTTTTDAYRRGTASYATAGATVQTIARAGRWDIELSMYFPNGSGTGVFSLLWGTASETTGEMQKPVPLLPSHGQIITWRLSDVALPAGGRVWARNVAGTWSIGRANAHPTSFSLKYLGPALVSD